MFAFEFPKVVKTLLQQCWFLPDKHAEFGLSLDCT